MTWIIIGMTIGITVILLITFNLSYFFWSNRNGLNSVYKKSSRSLKNFSTALIIIKRWAKINNYIFFSSTLFKYGAKNKLFGIDAIVLTNFGIVVVKIKTINGDISGSVNKNYLIKQTSGKKNKVINFVKKNDDAISNFIKMTKLKVPIVSLVVFFNDNYKLKIIHKPNHAIITKNNELIDILSKMNNSITHTLSHKKMKQIKKVINLYKTSSKKDKILYKKDYIENLLYEKKNI